MDEITAIGLPWTQHAPQSLLLIVPRLDLLVELDGPPTDIDTILALLMLMWLS